MHVLVTPLMHDSGDLRLRDTELRSERRLRFFCRSFSNLADLFICEFGVHRVSSTARVLDQTELFRMAHVFSGRYNLQVVEAVVHFITVAMVDLRTIWNLTPGCPPHQTVNKASERTGAVRKGDPQVRRSFAFRRMHVLTRYFSPQRTRVCTLAVNDPVVYPHALFAKSFAYVCRSCGGSRLHLSMLAWKKDMGKSGLV